MKRKKDRSKMPSRIVESNLKLVDSLIFDTPAHIGKTHPAQKVEDMGFIFYEPEHDIYGIPRAKVNRIKKKGIKDHFNNFNIGLLNNDIEHSEYRKRYKNVPLCLPKIGPETFLLGAAVHEVRHRLQYTKNDGKAISTHAEYESFNCFRYVLQHIEKHINTYYSKKLHQFDIEVDAYVVEAIFIRELWINISQRKMNYEDAVKVSASVITKTAAELAEVMNSVSYMPFM
jgi:hypothetical protein